MDPHAALARLRRLAAAVIDGYEKYEHHQLSESQLARIATDGSDLAQLFQGLDEWIVKQGVLPKDWDHAKGSGHPQS
jgi:hypothetical protein